MRWPLVFTRPPFFIESRTGEPIPPAGVLLHPLERASSTRGGKSSQIILKATLKHNILVAPRLNETRKMA
jgi:hypothetical protein